ncbi:MAG: class I SAM-dependent methyltransferase [Nitrospinae bacterium]|nr:class I SAM-dependent methyltransferase [Nitrospinota bacterium]
MPIFYTSLAKYYDNIYHYIDYKKQVVHLIELIKNFKKSSNNKILDVACGTGTHADLLQKAGFKVTGLDISKEMLELAKKKNSNIKFLQEDMKDYKIDKKFGTIICFFNSILYCKNRKELKDALTNFFSHLEEGGILIFDAVDKSIGKNSRKEHYEYKDDSLNIIFEPQWLYNQDEDTLNIDIDFKINGKKSHDHHTMGAFSFDELKTIIKESGFKTVSFEKDFETTGEYDYKYKSAIFVCRR